MLVCEEDAMLEFHCPHCDARLKCSTRMAGKESTCVKCGGKFLVPPGDGPMDESSSARDLIEPPPLEDFAPVKSSLSAPAATSRPADARDARRVFSWRYFFDWKFERYMTPWIIRFTWALSVIWAGCVIALLVVSMISSAIPSKESRQPDLRSQTDVESLLRTLSPQERSTGQRWAWKLIGYGTAVVACILSLLGTRVVLECLIVVFKIAETATSIDQSLKKQLRPGEMVES